MFDILDIDISFDTDSSSVADTSKVRRIFFDIEGGLNYNSDVIQLAYIMTDWDFRIKEVYDRIYRNVSPITPEETKVHGYTAEYLWKNSDTYFPAELPKLPFFNDMPTMYISYTNFDTAKLQEVAFINGIEGLNFGPAIGSLYSAPKISNWFNAFLYSKGRSLSSRISNSTRLIIDGIIEDISKYTSIKGLKAHNALYDTIATMALCLEMIR
jgi:hypothetical protein